ncbi:MAG TPA: FIST N-terminal domain-containing protein [Acidimicrobiales bacterium]|nr:FIST N-terminal domain-containing protein [Acidimicrobiales bacterium]
MAATPAAAEAGFEAACHAVRGRRPALVVAFANGAHDLEEVARGIRLAVPSGVPLVGCSTAGELAAGGDGRRVAGSCGLVVVALGGDGFAVRTGVATGASADLRGAGERAARAAVSGAAGHTGGQVVLLLSDGLAGDQQEVVRGAYSVTGAGLPLVGGCAGDDLRMERTTQLYGDGHGPDRALTDAVVAVHLSSDAPIGVGVHHGWTPVGSPVAVSSEGTRVRYLDGLPALDVYLERLQPPRAARDDPAAFTQFASTHPLGFTRRSGTSVRFVAGGDFRRRELLCVAHVPDDSLAHLMTGDRQSVLDATEAAARGALHQLGGAPVSGVIAFDCVARRGVLGDGGVLAEVERLAATVAGAPVAGFYTYGEFARTTGVTGFHNQTLVVLALA